ncbi:MAG: hypothetical protein MUO51_06365 [Woeseiaceae bacterium]|nr:hypothetical protein [Woeseiaceae bacterium]
MMEKLKNWLKERFSADESTPPEPLRRTGAHPAARRQRPTVQKTSKEFVKNDSKLSPTIEDGGPGKNVLIRNKYIREDTGTHETLKILDDSLIDSGEETGIDPYNTGGFDRSRNWSSRFRK